MKKHKKKPAKKRLRRWLIALCGIAVLAGSLTLYGYIARQDPQRMMENRIVKLERTTYTDMPAMRFIGMVVNEKEWPEAIYAREEMWERREEFLPALDAMAEYASDITEVCDLTHNFNVQHDEDSIEQYLVGKFMQANAPVPEGFDSFDIPAGKMVRCTVRGEWNDMRSRGGGIIYNKIDRGRYQFLYPEGWFFVQVYMDETIPEEGVVSRMAFMNPCGS